MACAWLFYIVFFRPTLTGCPPLTKSSHLVLDTVSRPQVRGADLRVLACFRTNYANLEITWRVRYSQSQRGT